MAERKQSSGSKRHLLDKQKVLARVVSFDGAIGTVPTERSVSRKRSNPNHDVHCGLTSYIAAWHSELQSEQSWRMRGNSQSRRLYSAHVYVSGGAKLEIEGMSGVVRLEVNAEDTHDTESFLQFLSLSSAIYHELVRSGGPKTVQQLLRERPNHPLRSCPPFAAT
jgi:hypothetical protein